jgi:hypothetical protein
MSPVHTHEQRKVTRSEGAKAFAVEVEVAVAFNKQQIKRKSSGASSALRGHRHLHERPWMISLRLLKSASRLRGDSEIAWKSLDPRLRGDDDREMVWTSLGPRLTNHSVV